MTWPGVIQLARGGDNLPHKCTSTKLAFCTTPLVNSCPLRMYACPLTKCGYLFVFSSLGWVWCDEQSFLSLSFMSLYTSWEKCSPTRSSFARWVGLLSMCCFMQANPPPPQTNRQDHRIIVRCVFVLNSCICESSLAENSQKAHRSASIQRCLTAAWMEKHQGPWLQLDPLSRVPGWWIWSLPFLY